MTQAPVEPDHASLVLPRGASGNLCGLFTRDRSLVLGAPCVPPVKVLKSSARCRGVASGRHAAHDMSWTVRDGAPEGPCPDD